MERQNIGFKFEKDFIENNNLIKEKNYIGEYDAYTQKGFPVQIKTYKENNELDLGDFKRNIYKNKNFILVCCSYKKDKEKIIFNSPKIIFINYNNYKKLFKCYNQVEEMYSFLKEITNNHSDDKKWKNKIKEFKNRDAIIQLRFKRDHKIQKRIQCAIPKNKQENFFNLFEEVNISDY